MSWGALLLLCLSCSSARQETLFALVEDSGIDFQNTVVDTKTDNSFNFRNFYNGGGVALGDISGDGLPDVVLTSNTGENKLYLNKGNFRFEDISRKAGFKQEGLWSTGVVMADVNADGRLDLYICSSGHVQSGNRRNRLYINNGDLTFTEKAREYGLDISGYCTQASFFDYDRDGDLDCFLINNSPIPFSSLNYATMRDVDIANWQVDEHLKGGGNHLYRNDGGYFREVTKEAGLHSGLISFGLGVSVGDINGDHYPDVYVGNDFIEKDYLYLNQKNGTFTDDLEQCIQKISMSSMSSDLGDINNDGYPEVFTTDMIPDDDYRLKTTGTFDNIDLYLSKQKAGLYHQYVRNCLQLNNGNGTFSEIANYSGVWGTDWSWGALFLDADNDGYNDIFVCNGINRDVGDLDFLDFFSNDVYARMVSTGKREELDEILKHIPVNPLPNRVFRNQGNLQFADVGSAWGFAEPTFSNSVAYGDLDGDGDLDLVINNENQPAFVYRNHARELNKNNYLAVQLKGSGQNPFAVGSQIKVYKGKEVLSREVNPARGFQSSVDYRQVIGLGTRTGVDSLVVVWPDGSTTRYDHPQLNQVHVLSYVSGNRGAAPATAPATLFKEVESPMEAHREDDYIDFYAERNLPQMLSREGPQIAKGDVNGDGREDVYIGGARGQAGQLYIQAANGGFQPKEQAAFQQYAGYEDVAVLLFDADRDKDLDLFIGSGGNNVNRSSPGLEHRLYINDGKGNFSVRLNAFSENHMNIAVAAANDYDGDGDLDLFVGGRSVPYAYGLTPQSYLYQNDGGGHFKDIAPPALSNVGMVTGAVWADVAGDGAKELVVTGQWMPTRVFTGKEFSEVKNTGLQDLYGWWQTLQATDVNGDGRQDLVVGNIGENFYLRPDARQPVKLWVSDFDHNGTSDPFLTRSIGGRDLPVFLKREVTEQFPGLKKQNLRHSDYARKSIQDLFPKDIVQAADVKSFNYCPSIVALNNGKGSFAVQPLPQPVQLSSVNAIAATDLNEDGRTDLVLGGNLFGFPPQFGRLDASYGHVLLGDGRGGFTAVVPRLSGMNIRGEVKDIKELKTNNKRCLLVVQNNAQPVLLEITPGRAVANKYAYK
jgi:enediyne biosynthesis protein E4